MSALPSFSAFLLVMSPKFTFNPLNAELNSICHLLALLGGATVVVVSRLRVNYDKPAEYRDNSPVGSDFLYL